MKRISPLAKYLKIYQKNPRSKVFAPLAQTYRRLGMYREALEVLKKGLDLHPTHTAGLVILAHVYYDTQKYAKALGILAPMAGEQGERYALQQLYARTNLKLGRWDDAQEAFERVLLLNPKDREANEYLKERSRDLQKVAGEDRGEEGLPSSGEEWVQVDFADSSQEGKKEILGSKGRQEADPIATHTLVDLYERQGHTSKAVEALEKIVELHPQDNASKERLEYLKRELLWYRDGQDIMAAWDERFSPSPDGEEKSRHLRYEELLMGFLRGIRQKKARFFNQDHDLSYFGK
ncbi:MAG: tetratricopeptide repeat protein [Bacteriovoracales bacterium]|nr:tetratricopeptide repeat protein [Bacteriovoracales bacterium]